MVTGDSLDPDIIADLLMLPSGQLYVGDATDFARAQPMSGDGTLTNTGVITVLKSNGVAFGSAAFMPASAFLPASGLPALADSHIVVGNALGQGASVLMNGDATLTNAGLITVTKSQGVAFGSAAFTASTSYDVAGAAAAVSNSLRGGSTGQILTKTSNVDLAYAWQNPAALPALTLTNGHIYVGNATNNPSDVSVSGDIGIDNTGKVTFNPLATPTLAKLGLGMVPVNVLDITQNTAAAATVSILNPNAGVNAAASFQLANGLYSAGLYMFGHGYSNAGMNRQDGVMLYNNGAGGLTLNTGSATPLYFATNGAERMRLDANGNLGIGMTPVNVLDITQTFNGFSVAQIFNDGVTTLSRAGCVVKTHNANITMQMFGPNWVPSGTVRADGGMVNANGAGGLTLQTDAATPIYFSTAGLERGRFDNGGAFIISTTASAAKLHVANGNTASTVNFICNNPAFASHMLFISAEPNTINSTYEAISFYCNASTEYRFNVHDSGNVVNKNNSYGAISDAKLKRDITPAASQWSDIKILAGLAKKFRHLNDDTFQLGLIAQDVEVVSPGLVEAIPDRELFEDTKQDGQDIVTFQNERFTGTSTKSVKYSVLYMKAVKALGEAMERIESLEERVDAIEI